MKSLLVFVALNCLPIAVTAEEVMVVGQEDGRKIQAIGHGQILHGPFTITRTYSNGKDTVLVNGLRIYPRNQGRCCTLLLLFLFQPSFPSTLRV